MDPLLWGDRELVEAAARHPLPLPLLVVLVLATGSPTWTYSVRQMWRLFDKIDVNGDGELSLAEIKTAMETDVMARAFVKSIGNATLSNLLSPPWDTTETAFRHIDADKSGALNRREWLAFIDEAVSLRLKHYKVKLLLDRVCFAGRGLEPAHAVAPPAAAGKARGKAGRATGSPRPAEDATGAATAAASAAVGVTAGAAAESGSWASRAFARFKALVAPRYVPNGWVDDYVYYISNNAKYASVFLADDEHPFGKWERTLDLFCVLGWSLFLSTCVPTNPRRHAPPLLYFYWVHV